MKWLDTGKDISITGKIGKCPHCKSNNTDYAFVIVNKENGTGYLDIWCNDCKKMGHISRAKINDNVKNVVSLEEASKVIPNYEITY